MLRKFQTTWSVFKMYGWKGLAGVVGVKLMKWYRPTVRDISDPYVDKLCFVNAGMLERGNLLCFDHAIANLPGDAPIVEIGSFCGLSTNLITYYKARHGVRNALINCDRWAFGMAGAEQRIGEGVSVTHGEYWQFVRESYMRNVRAFSQQDLPFTMDMLSEELFAAWDRCSEERDVFGRTIRLGGPISFCYIDGSHSYECAKRDFENCDRYLLKGGFVLFDDSAEGSGWEVCRVVAEVQASGRYRLVMKNPNCLFQKI